MRVTYTLTLTLTRAAKSVKRRLPRALPELRGPEGLRARRASGVRGAARGAAAASGGGSRAVGCAGGKEGVPCARAGAAVAAREVAALAHELRDDAVEGGALEVERLAALAHALLARAQSAEVLPCRGARRSAWDCSLALALSVRGSPTTGARAQRRGRRGEDAGCVIRQVSCESAHIQAAYLRSLGHDVSTKRHLDAAGRRATDGHVKEDDGSAHGCKSLPSTRRGQA